MPALSKQNLDIPFGQGLDTKSDPWRVKPGKMLSLRNTVFDKGGQLTKRDGFGFLPPLSDLTVKTLTTFKDSLTAIGESLFNYSAETMRWYNKGSIASVKTEVASLVRSATSQSAQDVAVASNGLTCSVWSDSDGTYKYQITDQESSQVIVRPVNLPSTATQARAFVLGRYFIITFFVTVMATTHLQYIALPVVNTSSPGSATDIATNVTSNTSGYDGSVINNNLYVAWSATGTTVKASYIDSTLVQHGVISIASAQAQYVSVVGDVSNPTPTIWIVYWNSSTSNLSAAAYSSTLVPILAPTVLTNNANVRTITALATDNLLTVYYTNNNTYGYSAVLTDFIDTVTCTVLGVVGTPTVLIRSTALASKAFFLGDKQYVMVSYGGVFQPTYFLCDESGKIIAKIAYSNGGGYPVTQVLPSANVQGTQVQIGYLFKDLLTSVNKTQGVADVNGIYSQAGINLVSWDINSRPMVTADIGNNLHLGGGFLWMYDGDRPVEHGFQVWPEDMAAVGSAGGGSLSAQQYYYQVVYEWTDAQGNLHRSSPSVPIGVLIAAPGSKTTLQIPTLRLTYKVAPNAVRIVIYRWSTAQENYYQVTSVSSPLLNNPAVDSVSYVDTLADSAILGNQLIYTTGGVIENIAAPTTSDISLFKSRLFLIDDEDPNLLWFSKQVIQNVPVEMSDLFTIYVAPTAGAQGSTGPNRVLGAMDDKLIIFKDNAIYYMTGNGPDITGANNDFSEPVFITSSVGCAIPRSLVLIPQGLMFQSDKGIWLLGRDLSTSYIGSPVEKYNETKVLSVVAIPDSTHVRFTLDSGVTLMYDYYFGQWGEFFNIPNVSSTLFEQLHTFVNVNGQVLQQTPNKYLDGSNPVLISFLTGWMNLAGLQGLERAYFFYLLGEYKTPHKLAVSVAYDYNSYPLQSTIIEPDNFSPNYGGDPIYGDGDPYGGSSRVEQWRVFLKQQKCQAFQIAVSEIYDPSFNVPSGAGLTLSGINLVVGAKKVYSTLKPSRSVT